jgi:HSP20 family protein
MLMRSDPFRELDRAFSQMLAGGTERPVSAPMDAYRHGDSFVAHLDLPGVDPGSIDVSVEQNVLTVTAERHWSPVDGDQVLSSERLQGRFTRQLFLGNALDTEKIHATYENGVLTITMPIADKAKPRKIEISATSKSPEPIETTAS